jgi:hypothetical protein
MKNKLTEENQIEKSCACRGSSNAVDSLRLSTRKGPRLLDLGPFLMPPLLLSFQEDVLSEARVPDTA